ncbi:YTH domain-containing protein, partial [Tanacetum coccineum]
SESLASSGLKSDSRAKMEEQNSGSRKDNIPSGMTPSFSGAAVSSVKSGVNTAAAEQGGHYTPTNSYDYQYPGLNATYAQVDGSGHGGAYPDNGSLLYYYNPYANGAFMGVDGQQPYFSSSEAMPGYSWNSKSSTGSNGMKSNDYNSKRTMNPYAAKSSSYGMDMKSPLATTVPPTTVTQSVSSVHSIFRSFDLARDKLGSAYQSAGLSKGYQPSGNFSSYAYQNQGLFSNYSMNYPSTGRLWNENDRYKSREKSYNNGESEELTRGPRAQALNVNIEEDKLVIPLAKDKYNLDEFPTKYDHAKFYVIKSYSEDDVHKCIKYDVWSSTPNGNKKLDAAYCDADGKAKIFLFFSVNGSGQFVGVAEMIGPVDYEKNMDFWQLDKWNGFFPVKWHIVKDVPNTLLRHIILENNDNRPVTYTRDTQEVALKQGLEMLEIFKSYSPKTSLLDDLTFYENREKLLKARRVNKAAFQAEKNAQAGERIIGEGSMSTNGLKDPTATLINLTRNLSLGDKSAAT